MWHVLQLSFFVAPNILPLLKRLATVVGTGASAVMPMAFPVRYKGRFPPSMYFRKH